MTEAPKTKRYDLEERSFQFAKRVVIFCKILPRTISNIEYIKQVSRASASVGANYIEANEALSRKDFVMRLKISRKEAKETAFWLRLLMETNDEKLAEEGSVCLAEAIALKKILSAILDKSQ